MKAGDVSQQWPINKRVSPHACANQVTTPRQTSDPSGRNEYKKHDGPAQIDAGPTRG